MAINLEEINPNTLYNTVETSKILHPSPGVLCNRRFIGLTPLFFKVGGRVHYLGKDLLEYIGVES